MINIIIIMLGLSVGVKVDGVIFLDISILKIIVMGFVVFCFLIVGGVFLGKFFYIIIGGKINLFIGLVGVLVVFMVVCVF